MLTAVILSIFPTHLKTVCECHLLDIHHIALVLILSLNRALMFILKLHILHWLKKKIKCVF